MQQRRLASSGRPTGTDGSDFNYRMVVDSRYQKVADGKSRLYALILTQAVFQLIGVLYTFLFTSKGEGPDVIAISSIAIGSISLILGDLAFSLLLQAVFQLIGVLYTFLFTSKGEGPDVIAISSIAIGSISLILGDLGRRRSRVTLLKVYMVASSIGVLLSIACVAKGNVTLEVFQTPTRWETHKFELLEAARTAIGFLVQIVTVSTITSLISNMSPPKRTS